MSDERLTDGALSMLETMLAGSVNRATSFGNTSCSTMELSGALAAVRELRARRAAETAHAPQDAGAERLGALAELGALVQALPEWWSIEWRAPWWRVYHATTLVMVDKDPARAIERALEVFNG